VWVFRRQIQCQDRTLPEELLREKSSADLSITCTQRRVTVSQLLEPSLLTTMGNSSRFPPTFALSPSATQDIANCCSPVFPPIDRL
jgi:hypothetical protein